MATILFVDDEVAIQRTVVPLLRSRGFAVTVASTGREALDAFEREPPDLIVLDLGLPDIDGLDVCRRIRERRDTPIVILSARGAEKEKVEALDGGADDYVTKPFGTEELLARVRAALRRSPAADVTRFGQLQRGNIVIDFDRRRAVIAGTEHRLTPREFELLTLLASNAGRVLTHRAILKAIWGPHSLHQPEQLRVLIGQLRKKIEPDPSHPVYLLTEPWVGYRFVEEPPG